MLADALVTVDIDEDSDLDLVARTPSADDQVMVFTNDGTGNFSPPTPYLPRSGYGSCGIVEADIDGDGHLDMVTGGVKVRLGDGTGHFAEDRGLLDGWPVVADVDGDDRPDVAVVRSTATPDHPAGTYVCRNRL